MPVEQLTVRYDVRPFTEDDLPQLLALCLGNPLYYAHLGEEVTLDSLRGELTVLPKGKALCDKYFFGLYDGGQLAAAIDLIDGYPEADVAYLGWLILAAERQGCGEGTAIVQELTDFLRAQGFRALRLACVVGNPQSARFGKRTASRPTASAPNGKTVLCSSWKGCCKQNTPAEGNPSAGIFMCVWRGSLLSRISIEPGGMYGGFAADFYAEEFIPRNKNRFLAEMHCARRARCISGGGGRGGGACSPVHYFFTLSAAFSPLMFHSLA